jgi:probable rRNA maturation factor
MRASDTTRKIDPVKERVGAVQVHRTGKQVFPSAEVRRIVRAVLAGENLSGRSVSVVLTGDAGIQELNARFLGHERPTDVIAFPMDDPDLLGEIYVSEERAREQSAQFGVTFDQEMARLVIHGVLHLAGFNDTTRFQKQKMTTLEEKYLVDLGC